MREPNSSMGTITPEKRITELDAIRAFAVLAVMYCHLPRGFWFGETGVDLFFVLSGYLISTIILENRERPGFIRVFYARRTLRIFPIYYLVLVGVYLLNTLKHNPGSTDGIGYYLLYLQNVHAYWGGTTPPVELSLGHTWTLAIEEQFYLLWPALILFVGNRYTVLISVLFILLPIGMRAQGFDRVLLFAHTDGLAWGSLLAWIQWRRPRRTSTGLGWCYLAIAIVGGSGYAIAWNQFALSGMTGKQMVQSNLGIMLISAAYFGLIGFLVQNAGARWLALLRWSPLVWMGGISYGLYLYHWVIYEQLDHIIKFGMKKGDPYWLDMVKVLLSFLVAAGSWYAIEKPILSLKRYFQYGKHSEKTVTVNSPAPLIVQPK